MGHKALAEVVYRMEGNRMFCQNLLSSFRMEAGSEESLQQVVCYKAKGETRELDLREWKER